MLRAAHLRLGHAAFDHTAKVFDLKSTRMCKCYICLIFKARGPSPTLTPMLRRAQKIGARVSLDAWCYATPAAVTGWNTVLGAVDECSDLFDAIGSKEPTGKITSDFLEYLWLLHVYQSEYRTELVAVRIDNGSVFDRLEFRTKAAKLKIRIELSAPYLHFQLRIERHWQTMKRDGVCMLATSRRKKTLFIHPCLHAAMIRCATRLPAESELGDDETQTKSAYEVATGKKYVLDALRVWGSNAYGTLLPEQRKQMRLDKADPTSVPGIYIGNRRDSSTFLILTPTKIHSMGAAMIDEKQLLKNMPVSEGFENEFTATASCSSRTQY